MSIFALHGFTGCGSDFEPFAQLCGGDWRCPDLPGHGASASVDCSPDLICEFVQSEIAQLKGTPRILFAYSMGARAALLHTVQHPQAWDALILISGNPGIEDERERTERRRIDDKLANRIENEGAPAFIEFWQSTPMIRSQKNIRPDWRRTMEVDRSQHTAVGLSASLRQFGQGSCPNLWPELKKITCPVLLITGEMDRKYCSVSKRMQFVLNNADHVVIPNVGHMPHLEAPEVTIAQVQAFLKEQI